MARDDSEEEEGARVRPIFSLCAAGYGILFMELGDARKLGLRDTEFEIWRDTQDKMWDKLMRCSIWYSEVGVWLLPFHPFLGHMTATYSIKH